MADFDVNSYIPPDSTAGQAFQIAQDNVGVAQQTYAQLSKYASALKSGSSDSQAEAEQALNGFRAAFDAVLPGSGEVLMYLYNKAPHASSGPGVCATDPPTSADPAVLRAWSHYKPWNWGGIRANYADPPAGSFEEFAYPVLRRNAELEDNCFSAQAQSPPALLAALIKAWNTAHSGPMRTITGKSRDVWGPQGVITDPIDYALEREAGDSYGDAGASALSFQVGTTPRRQITLNISPLIAAQAAAAKAAADKAVAQTAAAQAARKSTLKAAAVTAVISAALGLGAWAYVTRQTNPISAAKSLWREASGEAKRAVGNPLPRARSRSKRPSTKVQSLLLPVERFSPSEARRWAADHGFSAHKTHVTSSYVRLRQRPPSAFQAGSFRTVPFGSHGIKAVVGRPKRKS